MSKVTVSETLLGFDKSLAKDLTREVPRSPRETLGGYVIAARMLDKCRALLAGTQGSYKYDGFMDSIFFGFTGILAEDFKNYVATGVSDEAVAEWIRANAKQRDQLEIVKWNNACRYQTIQEMPERFQLFMEDYIEQNVPKHRPIYFVFDIFDLEEGRL